MLLAGDIGGTKTNLAIYAPDTPLRTPLAQGTYPSGQYESLDTLVQEFVATTPYTLTHACFGVAGPVVNQRAQVTNLPWIMTEQTLTQNLGLQHVRLINDLEAIAAAVPVLLSEDLVTLNEGTPVERGALAVIAPGTGLGEAFLIHDGSGYRACASEGGHTSFAPITPREEELLRFLQKRYDGHVSYERVCSGHGLPNIYAFLKESGYAAEPDWLSAQLAAALDPAPVIVNAALAAAEHGMPTSELCAATLETFIQILAAEAGNLALKVMATGGVYIGGGIPPRILSVLTAERFLPAFTHKGRLSGVLTSIPVHVIRNAKVALLGAAIQGLATLR